MNFNKGKIKDIYLLTTDVENMFINEYVPAAPGDYVKIYLYGLLYAQHGNSMTHQILARQLNLSEDTVNSAWEYWEKMGAVKKVYNKDPKPLNYDIEFLNLRERMYGNFSKDDREENRVQAHVNPFDQNNGIDLQDKAMKDLFDYVEITLGRTLSARENEDIASWINQMGVTDDLVREAFAYCCERGKTNVNYVAKVVIEWHKQGLNEKQAIRQHIENLEQRQGIYKNVLNSLGLNRNATSAEKKMINSWIDEMGFSMERILAACDTTLSTANPNLRYVNKVLENWRKEAMEQGRDVNQKVTVSQAVLNKYYEFLRQEAEASAEARKQEVYEAVPRIAEIDNELKILGSRLSRGLLSGMTREKIDETKKIMNLEEEERAVLLTENNFTVDYTDIKYSCEKCSDTGIGENGQRCSCTKERIGEAEIWQKKNM